jgi:trans-AT polyketide synthase/acyltransferase/oxidoreductase domain-containing protein
MGRELYERDPGFRAVMRHADQVVHAHCGESVLATVFAEDKGRHIALDRLLYSHLAIFMVEYALAKTLIDRGVQADMVLGASLGAFAAATVAGCMDPDIALSAVLEQAITLEACCQAGCMMAVMGERDRFLSPELLALCEHGASNFASHSVIALPESNRAAVEVWLSSNFRCVSRFIHAGSTKPARVIDPSCKTYRCVSPRCRLCAARQARH